MAHVKTAISVQKSIFDQVEALAHELNISRSQLFNKAAEEFVQRHNNQKLLEQINAVYDDLPEEEDQRLLEQMRSKQRKILQEEQW